MAIWSLGDGLEEDRTGSTGSWNSEHLGHIRMGERVLLELSWESWHYTNLPNVVLNTWCLVKHSSHSDICPVVL